MALSASTLSDLIRANLLGADAGWLDNEALTATCDAIADAVVTHIQSAAVVNPLGLTVVDPVSGVLPVVGAGTIQ